MTSQAVLEEIESSRTFNRSMGLLAAVAIAAVVGLVAGDGPGSEPHGKVLQTDANEQRPVGATAPSVDVPIAAPSNVLDPTLSRPGQNGDQHG